jgi:hypothetical protein
MKSVDFHPQAHIFLLYKRRQLRSFIGGKRETTYGTGARIAPSTRRLTTKRNIAPIRTDPRSESSVRSVKRERRSGRATEHFRCQAPKVFSISSCYSVNI